MWANLSFQQVSTSMASSSARGWGLLASHHRKSRGQTWYKDTFEKKSAMDIKSLFWCKRYIGSIFSKVAKFWNSYRLTIHPFSPPSIWKVEASTFPSWENPKAQLALPIIYFSWICWWQPIISSWEEVAASSQEIPVDFRDAHILHLTLALFCSELDRKSTAGFYTKESIKKKKKLSSIWY